MARAGAEPDFDHMYGSRAESAHHAAAVRAITALAEGSILWGLPAFVIGEFLRVATHPRTFQPPTTPGEAMDAMDRLLASPRCRLLAPGDRYWVLLRETLTDSAARGNMLFDAQIVAVCREHGVDTILTQDRDFRRFEGIRVQRLG